MVHDGTDIGGGMWQSGVIAIESAAEREVAAAAIKRRDDKGDDDAHLKLGEVSCPDLGSK